MPSALSRAQILSGAKQVRKQGKMIVLQPGETRRYDLEIGVLTGREQIGSFTKEIARVRES